MTTEEENEVVVQKYDPLTIYQNLERFRDNLRHMGSEKSPSVMALQMLTRTKPELAKKFFEIAVMEPFYRLLKNRFPGPSRLSAEGAKWIEEVASRFVQEPVYALAMLEAIFVIERIEPWAEDTIRLLSKGKSTLKEARRYPGTYAYLIENGIEHARGDLSVYVRERNYRLMLALVAEIDGTSIEAHIHRILTELPKFTGKDGEFSDETTESLIGHSAADKLVAWILGYIEF